MAPLIILDRWDEQSSSYWNWETIDRRQQSDRAVDLTNFNTMTAIYPYHSGINCSIINFPFKVLTVHFFSMINWNKSQYENDNFGSHSFLESFEQFTEDTWTSCWITFTQHSLWVRLTPGASVEGFPPAVTEVDGKLSHSLYTNDQQHSVAIITEDWMIRSMYPKVTETRPRISPAKVWWGLLWSNFWY